MVLQLAGAPAFGGYPGRMPTEILTCWQLHGSNFAKSYHCNFGFIRHSCSLIANLSSNFDASDCWALLGSYDKYKESSGVSTRVLLISNDGSKEVL